MASISNQITINASMSNYERFWCDLIRFDSNLTAFGNSYPFQSIWIQFVVDSIYSVNRLHKIKPTSIERMHTFRCYCLFGIPLEYSTIIQFQHVSIFDSILPKINDLFIAIGFNEYAQSVCMQFYSSVER